MKLTLNFFLHSCSFCIILLLCSCAKEKSVSFLKNPLDDDIKTPSSIVSNDPNGPIPEPKIPSSLVDTSSSLVQQEIQVSQSAANLYSYTLDVDTKENDTLQKLFLETSLLEQMREEDQVNQVTMELRLHADIDGAKKVLQSQGYYDGTATGNVELKEKNNAVIHIQFLPGQQYTIGKTKIIVQKPKSTKKQKIPKTGEIKDLPQSLSDVGLETGSPAIADDILATVNDARTVFRNNGYPFAKIINTKYTIDKDKKQLEAEVSIIKGKFTRMGDLDIQKIPKVRIRYLEVLKTWKKGQPWNQQLVENYRDALRASGLFQRIDLDPSPLLADKETRNIKVSLEKSLERTVSGGIKYDSDFGPGIEGVWENRNLTGNGDRFTIKVPLWVSLQQIAVDYRFPFIFDQKQDIIAKGFFINEDSDAYQIQSVSTSIGIERRFTNRWFGSVAGSAEGGYIKDPGKKRRSYSMYGLPITITYDSTDSLLNAVKGVKASLISSPYFGSYGSEFSVVRGRLNLQAYQPLIGKDTLLLALRGTGGAFFGADNAQKVPPSIRFYSGGGGSVRGYSYQSLGPRNDSDDPLGGSFLTEVSTELRYKLSEEWGIVSFIDGGTAFETSSSNYNDKFRWGAGLGIRYYTAIGPVRFDVATPLTPREDDAFLQFYISIGQSF